DSLGWLETCPFNLTEQCVIELKNQTLCKTDQTLQEFKLTAGCVTNYMDEYCTTIDLPWKTVESLLKIVMNLTTCVMDHASDQNNLISFGNAVLDKIKILVSTLANKTNSFNSTTVSVQNLEVKVFVFGPDRNYNWNYNQPPYTVSVDVSVNINPVALPKMDNEVRVFMVGHHVNLTKTPSLITSNAAMDIDLIGISKNNHEVEVLMTGPNSSSSDIPRLSTGNSSMDIDIVYISKNNNGSAAVAFLSYTNMIHILKPTLFKPNTSTHNIIMSTVVLALLLNTTNTELNKPESEPEGILSCVDWNTNAWLGDNCEIIQTNKTHTVCSCDRLSTFALIMQIDSCRPDQNSFPKPYLLS
ncbi:adhesion G protein-coupled receptor E3-like, partial [Clarias magur]